MSTVALTAGTVEDTVTRDLDMDDIRGRLAQQEQEKEASQ
jgi:hypothetical protein